MMKATALAAVVLGMAFAQAASAQTEQPASAPQAQSALATAAQDIVANEPPVHVKVQIVGIDRASRVITVRGPRGNEVQIGLSQQVANFDKLNVGDTVDVLYKNALLVTAEKVTGKDKGIRKRVDTNVYLPASSGYDAARQVEVQATVQHINAKKREVTLRGAYQTVTLEATPDVDLKKLKVGDTIHAVFVSAYATQVTPVGATD
ncbi:RND efflux pump membrane fusion protein barrel-sandwich domain-containing protein [Paraburkholderia sacchari]